MSEYQYYEFQAIDRPLNKKAVAELRAISSRAEITPTSLINEYQWGDFKGAPRRLMEHYFDAFIYVANWGSRWLMFRLPIAALRMADVKPYLGFGCLDAWSTKTHVILDFRSEDDSGEDFDGSEGWLASLIPLRSELLAHDLRSLYLGWLAGVHNEDVEECGKLPVPAGMRTMTASQRRLADFLRLDDDVLQAAARTSANLVPQLARGGPISYRSEPGSHSPHFTPRQGQFLAFLKWYCRLNRRSPAETDFVRYFRLTPPSVHSMIVKLDELGLITREPGVARSVRLAISEDEVPELEQIEVSNE